MRRKSPYQYALALAGQELLCSPEQVMAIVRFQVARQQYYVEVKDDSVEVRLSVSVIEAFETYLRQYEPQAVFHLSTWKSQARETGGVYQNPQPFTQRLQAAYEGFLSKSLQLSELAKIEPAVELSKQARRTGSSAARDAFLGKFFSLKKEKGIT